MSTHWNKAQHDRAYKIKHRHSAIHRTRRREKFKRWLKANPAKMYEYVKKWQKKNPEKRRAHDAVKYALLVGKLKRPERCEECGVLDPKRADGRSGLHAHHDNYSEKLKVKFICAVCHGLHKWK